MKKILLSSLATAAVTLSTGTYAESLFTFIDYGFGKVDVSSSDDDYTSLSGAFETSGGPYVAFESTEYGSLDVMAVGAGVYSGVGSQSNVFGQLQYVEVDRGQNDETGFRLTAGITRLNQTIKKRLSVSTWNTNKRFFCASTPIKRLSLTSCACLLLYPIEYHSMLDEASVQLGQVRHCPL